VWVPDQRNAPISTRSSVVEAVSSSARKSGTPAKTPDQLAHPDRAFRGRDQVRANWSGVFAGVPDFRAELLTASTTEERVEIGEFRWSGTHTDGAPFAMQGVIVLGVEEDRIAWGRLYMEPVEAGGGDIDQMVQETYRPPR